MIKLKLPLWTPDEAEVVEARLRQIWNWSGEVEWKRDGDDEGFLVICIQLNSQVRLTTAPDHSVLSWQEIGAKRVDKGKLIYSKLSNKMSQSFQDWGYDQSSLWHDLLTRCIAFLRRREFLTQWLPLFRRGLWLSGLPIEASAHEKAEWLQGFSREEVEAWNLKM